MTAKKRLCILCEQPLPSGYYHEVCEECGDADGAELTRRLIDKQHIIRTYRKANEEMRRVLPRVYLACPYSHDDPQVRQERYLVATRVAGNLMRNGHIVFSPLSHSHPMGDLCDLPNCLNFWMMQDLPFVEWADQLFVVTLPGWGNSPGVRREIEHAEILGKRIRYVHPDTCEVTDYAS